MIRFPLIDAAKKDFPVARLTQGSSPLARAANLLEESSSLDAATRGSRAVAHVQSAFALSLRDQRPSAHDARAVRAGLLAGDGSWPADAGEGSRAASCAASGGHGQRSIFPVAPNKWLRTARRRGRSELERSHLLHLEAEEWVVRAVGSPRPVLATGRGLGGE